MVIRNASLIGQKEKIRDFKVLLIKVYIILMKRNNTTKT